MSARLARARNIERCFRDSSQLRRSLLRSRRTRRLSALSLKRERVMLRWMIAVASSVLFALSALAQSATTGPTTTGTAKVPADQSSPRGALKVLAVAMDSGDADALRAVLSASTPQEHRML